MDVSGYKALWQSNVVGLKKEGQTGSFRNIVCNPTLTNRILVQRESGAVGYTYSAVCHVSLKFKTWIDSASERIIFVLESLPGSVPFDKNGYHGIHMIIRFEYAEYMSK